MTNGLAKGYTKMSNKILETITREDFTKREYKVLLYVFRNGYGYNREQSTCALDVKQIIHDTGLDRSHVWTTLHSLEGKRVLNLEDNEIRFNRHADQWVMAKTATKRARPKQPQNMAETAMDCGRNSHEEDCSHLTVSDLQAPKEKLKKKETPLPPEKRSNSRTNSSRQAEEQILAFLNETTGKSSGSQARELKD